MGCPEELNYTKDCEWLRQRSCQCSLSNTLYFHNYAGKEGINIRPWMHPIGATYLEAGKELGRI